MDPALYSHLTIAQWASVRINNSIQKLKWSSLHFRKNIASVVSRLIRTAHGLRTRTQYSLHPGNRMKRAFRKNASQVRITLYRPGDLFNLCNMLILRKLNDHLSSAQNYLSSIVLDIQQIHDMWPNFVLAFSLLATQPVELDIRQNLPERLYNSLFLFGSDSGCGKIFSHRVRQCTDKQCPYQSG